MPKKNYDWKTLELTYVTGDDEVTYESLAKLPNSPAVGTIKTHASERKWVEKRQAHRDSILTKTTEELASKKAIAGSQHLIEVSDMIKRHLTIARGMQLVITKRLKTLQENPDDLSVRDLVSMAQLSTSLERLSLDLATSRVEVEATVDLTKLSDEQLAKLAEGNDLEKVMGD